MGSLERMQVHVLHTLAVHEQSTIFLSWEAFLP